MASDHDWHLSMHQIENCSCSHGCGCQFSGFPTSANGGCQAVLGFIVIKGHFKGLDLTGLKMVFAADWPGAMHDGNGSGALFIDNAASQEQVVALATIMSGQAGGMPVEALGTLFSSFDGPLMADITLDRQDYRSTIQIEGVVDVSQEPHINPVTGEENRVHIGFPEGGFMWNDGFAGKTKLMKINHGNLAFEYSDTFAANAVVNWPTG
ncbi:DUF1326 domain-containing protein [Thalassotalea sp. Y01]|uniref:DUF1326 domain-containing protein n=1 Tax=Thalassotalea sp. Y01 TaxID=2729613 RepID=UPI00145F002D|nr:DUF1326 domain-containing protein [Thalassotalea sp. Y01]NMP15096.1 DUF1326 domain-containing protein [Thalassotalea sp. Y01]